jgi:hypothetical protein
VLLVVPLRDVEEERAVLGARLTAVREARVRLQAASGSARGHSVGEGRWRIREGRRLREVGEEERGEEVLDKFGFF